MKTNGEDSAFSKNGNSVYSDYTKKHTYENVGLSKREYFAALSMQGILSAIYSDKNMLNDFLGNETGRDAVSRNAVSYADALIEELNKT